MRPLTPNITVTSREITKGIQTGPYVDALSLDDIMDCLALHCESERAFSAVEPTRTCVMLERRGHIFGRESCSRSWRRIFLGLLVGAAGRHSRNILEVAVNRAFPENGEANIQVLCASVVERVIRFARASTRRHGPAACGRE